MSAESFAYALLLRGTERRESLLALLPKDRRETVESVLEDASQSSPEQIHEELRKYRTGQRKVQREATEKRLGISLDRVGRKLAVWLARPF